MRWAWAWASRNSVVAVIEVFFIDIGTVLITTSSPLLIRLLPNLWTLTSHFRGGKKRRKRGGKEVSRINTILYYNYSNKRKTFIFHFILSLFIHIISSTPWVLKYFSPYFFPSFYVPPSFLPPYPPITFLFLVGF